MSANFQHSSLGELKGNVGDGTVQFLGLKYANLKNRLAAAELVEGYGSGAIDASKYGPPPVSPVGAVNREFGFIQHSLPIPDVPTHSDIEGLNLNITVPRGPNGDINSNSKLPVYVFIHGGGFAVGSSWYPHYNPASIVKLSAEKGKPIIGITINYRLGVTGFLSSEELRNAGYKANNGLHDQRTAMRWIKKFIGGFGGDPDEITAVGESAGGLSVTMFLCSKEPLMKRCLSTGGATLLFKPIPLAVAESSYQQIIKAFGLADKSPEERIEALLSLPVDDLWQKVPLGALLLPAVDGDTVPGTPDFLTVSSKEDNVAFLMPGRKWCNAVMIGESKLDANILAYMGLDARKANIAQKFIHSVNATLASHPSAATALLSSYNITPSTPDDEALLSILRFATEISFYAPARAFAQGWPNTSESKFFLYHFNEGIPWPGRFQGEAGHILDVSYLFQNFNEHLNKECRELAKKFAEDFIDFVNGEDPWPPVQGQRLGARVYGPSSEGVATKYVEDGNPVDVGRNDRVLKLGELAGFDNILDAFQNFFQGQ
ncbi:alpha/beta-hydrolase [Cucurbitaria berberidis CBS 394.84]|uniref:Alpha/beta-hydrolase n=1 Tax=Cucurbitaria berberidis CBS 394.84 TaxID=1168544 RepID=A0A9P4L5B4_9PLEO|nr:alpha/beta-hydrolase [Cucurbitaria berberidis CBS 394.84]KAF1842781.1 alpha/beta-hydrolase [Cucurbitaria berberidis CBS 394.84]